MELLKECNNKRVYGLMGLWIMDYGLFFDKRTIDRFVFHEMRMRSTRFQIISPSRTRFRTGQKYFSYR